MNVRRFLASGAALTAGATIVLDPDESAHAARVLRLRAGDRARVFDGQGVEFGAELIEVAARRSVCRLLEPLEPPSRETPVPVVLAFALAKKTSADYTVQKATELGATRLYPFVAERSVARVSAENSARPARWRKIIRDATKQCGRAYLCALDELGSFQDALATPAQDEAIFVCQESIEVHDSALLSQARQALTARPAALWVFIGPEGGFSDAEVSQARERGARLVSLGGRVLRAETAAAAALAQLTAVLESPDAVRVSAIDSP